MTAAILETTRQGLLLVLLVSLPVVAVATVSALLIAIAQAVTQIQDQSIGMSVRLIAVMVTIVVLAGWGGREVLRFARMAGVLRRCGALLEPKRGAN
jgi:type III secretion protein S